jgi:mono/diheme cytochrome c family protein
MIVLTVLLMAAAPVQAASPPGPTAAVTRGQAFAEKHCARCHSVGPSGDSPYPLAPAFREIVKRYPVEDLQEAFAEGVRVGHPEMPEFTLEPPQIEDLMAYLKTLRHSVHAEAAASGARSRR